MTTEPLRAYCSFRNKRTCVGPVVETITKRRFRCGQWEDFHYGVCAYHATVVSRW